jgi:NAD(P)-dependent dehydrogenase (short-subunit alcohol dehydrogenase family)
VNCKLDALASEQQAAVVATSTRREVSMSTQTVLILGVGPDAGLGAALCRRFAKQGLHVVVAGRTAAKVEHVAAGIRASGGMATGMVADATDESAVVDLVARAESIGPIAAAIYNAGNNMHGDFLSMDAIFFENCWRVCCFGGFLFSREVLRRMSDREAGTLIFTGASASMRGKPYFAPFTAAKAGLRALAQSLAREFGPKGIHVGHVVIDGGIHGEKVMAGAPDFAKRLGPEGLIGLEGLADVYQMLHNQPRNAWSHEIDVRTHREIF